MSDDQDYRRLSDRTILEIHGMLQSHLAHYEEHVRQDNERHEVLERRLQPVEELNQFTRVLIKIGGVLLAISGMGGVIAAGRTLLSWSHAK